MKKGVLTFLLTFLIIIVLGSFSEASITKLYYDGKWHDYDGIDISLKINGEDVTCEMPPIVFDGNSLVPAREVFEALGAVVSWNESQKTAGITYGDVKISLKLNSNIGYVNNVEKELVIAPKIINSKTMIPTRFVAEELGFDVWWSDSEHAIYINNKQKDASINSINFAKEDNSNQKAAIDIAADKSIENYSTMYLQNPYRLVIDINDAILNLQNKTIPVEEGGITQVRTSQYAVSPNKTRIVVDFQKQLKYQVILSEDKKHIYVAVTLDVKPSNQGGTIVVIDPGHGGNDPGAIYGGRNEKELNLIIATYLKPLLEQEGITVYMTRDSDTAVDLYARSALANNLNANLLLSIHNNAMDDQSFDGTMTLYYPDNNGVNRAFANMIQNAVISGLGTTDRGLRERPNLAVLRTSQVPAALVEVAFMTNASDMRSLNNDEFLQLAAKALKDGIINYLNE